jgi:hypothetical protein
METTIMPAKHMKLASYQMKTRYDRLANCAGYYEGSKVWLSPKPHKGEISQAPILMGGPIEGNHPDKCGIQDPAEP